MKRSIFGLVLLLLLLGSSWISSIMMDRIHRPIAEKLDQAAVCALESNWQQADLLCGQALEQWQTWAHFRGCFADHAPVEEIEADAASLKVYAANRDGATFAAACYQLARQVQAMGDAHGLLWWNLL